MRKLTLMVLIGCFLHSCSFVLSESDIVNRLKNQKEQIDGDISMGIIFSHSVAALNNGQDVNSFFQLYQNKGKVLLMASETPMRGNTPSDTILCYYFDENEVFFALQVKVNVDNDSLFNSVTAFYDRDMQIVNKEYGITDNCNIEVDKTTDSLAMDFSQFKIPATVRTFVKEKSIFLPNK